MWSIVSPVVSLNRRMTKRFRMCQVMKTQFHLIVTLILFFFSIDDLQINVEKVDFEGD